MPDVILKMQQRVRGKFLKFCDEEFEDRWKEYKTVKSINDGYVLLYANIPQLGISIALEYFGATRIPH